MEALVSLGVDGMFTNFPARLEQMLGKYAANGKTAAKEASEATRPVEPAYCWLGLVIPEPGFPRGGPGLFARV